MMTSKRLYDPSILNGYQGGDNQDKEVVDTIALQCLRHIVNLAAVSSTWANRVKKIDRGPTKAQTSKVAPINDFEY